MRQHIAELLSEKPIVEFLKISEKAEIPKYAYEGDACCDLSVLIDINENKPIKVEGNTKTEIMPRIRATQIPGETINSVVIKPQQSIMFHTGLKCAFPQNLVMMIFVRSSIGIKDKLQLTNGTGIIDSGYRGELFVSLTNIGDKEVKVHNGDRVAQLAMVPVFSASIKEATELSESKRGQGGIGSSGKNESDTENGESSTD